MARAAAPSALGFAESPAMEEDEACRRLHPRTDGNAMGSAGAVACERTPHRRKGTPVRKTTYTLSIVLGSILIIGGVATWILVSTTLADQKITVSDDASCLAGDEVDGPFSAYCEAMVIDKHALEATGGLRYSELDREDPKRQTAQTASFLQASLFTSVVAFGVAAMAIAIGVLFILIGLGIRDVANRIDVASRTPATA
jgi:hypothetical protein